RGQLRGEGIVRHHEDATLPIVDEAVGLAEVPIPAEAAGPDEGGDVRQLEQGGDLDDLGHQRALRTIGSITGSRRSPKLVRARSMTSLSTDLSVFTAPRLSISRTARVIDEPRLTI